MKVGIIGTGKVGSAIGGALASKGYEVIYGSRNPQQAKVPQGTRAATPKEAATEADVVIMAVPYSAVKDAIKEAGKDSFKGKTVVDVTNPLGKNMDWAVGFKTSSAEEMAKEMKGANVVKAFNTVFAEHMAAGNINGEKLGLFIASDSDDAKRTVREFGEKIGFDVIDAGKLEAARYLEALGMLNIHLGYKQNMGSKMGFKVVR